MIDTRRVLLVSLLFAAPAAADVVVARGLTFNDAHVTGVKGSDLIFTTSAGTETTRPLTEVTKLEITNEPAFNAAEAAFGNKDYDKAATEYEKVLRMTSKAWLKDFAAVRLLEAANKGNRFDAAVKGWLALAEKSPETARGIPLTMPPANSTYLPEAIKSVQAALAKNPPVATQEVLVNMLVELAEARGDAALQAAASRQRVDILVKKDPNSPEALKAQQQMRIAKIQADLDAKKYDEVMAAVNAEAEKIVDPNDTATMLWIVAEAQRGKTAAGAAKEAWMDVAVAYMRVVANGPREHAKTIDALQKVADLYATKLNDKEAARGIYKRMAEDYKNHEAGQVAQREMDKLK